jgi:hypothetical protein
MRTTTKVFWLAQAFVAGAALVLFVRFNREERPPVVPTAAIRPYFAREGPAPVQRPAAAPAPVRREADLAAGIARAPEEYLSRVIREDDYEQWTLDLREMAWLLANRREVLARDLETSPEPDGGLRVRRLRDACFGARHGLRVGDVLLDINGQELDSAGDLEDFLEDPAYAGSRGWRLRLRRGDETLVLDYRAEP